MSKGRAGRDGREGLAIVGMGCRFPDARSPAELWENALARRRAFRRMPPERLRLDDYRDGVDGIELREAALLAGWEFDRVRFKVTGDAFRVADLTHWLALEVAADALADAGFADGAGLPRDATGVLVGNSLTGEFSRAQLLRLRWPYVRRVLASGLAGEGWTEGRIAAFTARLEAAYKAPFPAPNEESLAGGLSNTIAGRICNHFDLHGGGYTVDGACASSLLAVAQACTALAAGDLEVALAGGVDLSLDPFELVGFSRAGALAAGEMWVYDARSRGFLPGEGCGFVVLMRERQAQAAGKRIHAVIRGWGISSDGHGGISRPEAAGQRLALARAYRRAGFGIETVPLFEGHGTGTAVGDATELAALSQALREARAPAAQGGGEADGAPAGARGALGGNAGDPDAAAPAMARAMAPAMAPAAIGSIKANIGHTKAAAGIAGLIKATQAVARQILPPATGCEQPHPGFAGAPPLLRAPAAGEPWPAGRPLRAGISAMGFGGVNAHLVIEGTAKARRRRLTERERRLLAPSQDVHLLPLAAADAAELAQRARQLAGIAPRLSRAELGDLAAELHRRLGSGPAGGAKMAARAAIVAATPEKLAGRAAQLVDAIEQGATRLFEPRQGVFLGVGSGESPPSAGERGGKPPRVGLLFTGQGSAAHSAAAGGALARRFPELAGLYDLAAAACAAAGAAGDDGAQMAAGATGDARDAGDDTAVAQPAIVAHCLAGLWLLDRLGVRAGVAVGHSLGEIAALHWAGACGAEAAMRLAAARGRAMAEKGEPGAMASLAAAAAEVEDLLAGGPAAIAAYNGAARTVVSGSPAAVAAVIARAAARGVTASRLRVSRAFHSPLVAAAAPDLDRALALVAWSPLRRPVASTVTGGLLAADADPRGLLLSQLTAPVRFAAALGAARPLAELWIEVGPGRALAELAGEAGAAPALALDAGGPSLAGPWNVAAALFAAGVPVDLGCLFEGRFHRPFDLDRPLRFLASPCESAPVPPAAAPPSALPGDTGVPRLAFAAAGDPAITAAAAAAGSPTAPGAPIDLLRGLVAARAELPPAAVREESRLLADLHLNSITVGQLVVEASRQLGLAPPASPTDYALATIGEVAQAFSERLRLETSAGGPGGGSGSADPSADLVAGVDAWVRPFTVELVERPLPRHRTDSAANRTAAPAPAGPAHGGVWRVIAPQAHPLAAPVGAALRQIEAGRPAAGGGQAPGVLVCLPARLDERREDHLELFAAAARAVTATGTLAPSRFVILQHGGGGGGFARTLHLELPAIATWVIDLPPDVDPAAAASWVAAEVAAGDHGGMPAYVEAHYDARGARRVPLLRPLAVAPAAHAAAPAGEGDSGLTGGSRLTGAVGLAGGLGVAGLGEEDVLLVTGGGKGIGAECALALARASGARLAILGRSDPQADAELAANLARMSAGGVPALYLRADLGDEAAVRSAVAEAVARLGAVTCLLHAAGINAPRPLSDLEATGLRQTLLPKVGGARHLLAALDALQPGRLQLVVGFGSIVARTGLRGEADYALANEWLGLLLGRFGASHPSCRCLLLDWSVWSGVGMGERLGTLAALRRQGITPIPPDTGAAELLRLLADPAVRGAVVVTGRFGSPPTLAVERPELPLLRFLETPRVHYPGIELVVDTEISADTDPYLADHVFRGEPLFAAVIGLEAIAQAAAAVTGILEPPVFERVELRRPVAVAAGRSTRVRLAALVRAPGLVEVALRDESTGFAADHFRAICRFAPPTAPAALGADSAAPATTAAARLAAPSADAAAPVRLAIDPTSDLYGGILFHTGRFRRLGGYRRLRATECLAEVVPDGSTAWFGRYLPPALLLGDPAARDAAIHAIQACIPHAQLLPIGVERITAGCLAADAPLLIAARERSRHGDTYLYDLDILGADGSLRERWQGLRLRAVDRTRLPDAWSAALLAPYLERRLQELLPHTRLQVALEDVPEPAAASPAAGSRRAGGRPESAAVIGRLLGSLRPPPCGRPARLGHRPDGRPEVAGGPAISISHAADLVLAVARGGRDEGRIGCDLEAVSPRTAATWRHLLGAERFALAELIARQQGEPPDAAATRVWTAAESLHKAGLPAGAPLLLEAALDDGWLLLRCGELRVASFTAAVRELGGRCALAVVAPAAAAGSGAETQTF